MESLLENLPDTVSNAFHGTGHDVAKVIMVEGFSLSVGDQFHLGDGVYFYVGDMQAAIDFARRVRDHENPTVLRATIRLGLCLDFLVTSHRRHVVRLKTQIERVIGEPVGVGRVINFMADNVCTVETVKACQPNRKSITSPRDFIGSSVWLYAKILLCVRNPSNILGQSIVYAHRPTEPT